LGRDTWESCSGNLEDKWEPSQNLRLGPRKTKKTWVEMAKNWFEMDKTWVE